MKLLASVVLLGTGAVTAVACDLCAVYSATSARGDADSGPIFTLNQQYIPFHTLQYEGEVYRSFPEIQANRRDLSITHLVPGYNFTPELGLNLNVPIIYQSFHRVVLEPTMGQIIDERGSEFGLGDVSLIGRWTVFQKAKMSYSIALNVLAGVKFPTGDTQRLDNEVNRERFYNSFFGESVHAHEFGGVHEHDLTLGSGSFDGIFGTTLNLRWKQWFFNQQAQYYLRTEARGYQFGDLIIISGGPGGYILATEDYSLSLQANALYESMAQDVILGQIHDQTGLTAWYLGPQVVFTLGDQFSAQAGVDIPLRIYNHGLQNVPDYRIHAGFRWRF
jgi:hypothetical protein